MNLIAYIFTFYLWHWSIFIMSRLNLIKDINDKQSKAENIISNAINKTKIIKRYGKES